MFESWYLLKRTLQFEYSPSFPLLRGLPFCRHIVIPPKRLLQCLESPGQIFAALSTLVLMQFVYKKGVCSSQLLLPHATFYSSSEPGVYGDAADLRA